MSDRRPDEDSESPWAGTVPIAPPPVEFTWARTDADPQHHPAVVPPPGTSGGSMFGAGLEPGPPSAGGSRVSARRSWLAVAGVAAALALVAGVVVARSGNGDDAASEAASSLPDAAESGDSLPAAGPTRTAPDTTEVDVDDSNEPSTTDSSTGGGGGSAAAEELVWSEDVIELPEPLASAATPYTIVMVSADGMYRELHVPSGRVDEAQLPFSGSTSQLVAGATSSLLASFGGGPSMLVRVGEQPVTMRLPDNRNEMRAVPGADEFVTIVYDDGFGDGGIGELRVRADGSVESGAAATSGPFAWQTQYGPGGAAYFTDAGGVYRIDDGAVDRVSTGMLVTSSGDQLLVRECDEQLMCALVVIDPATGDRFETALDAASIGAFIDAAELSPDGQWLRYFEYGPSEATETIVNLVTGENVEVDGLTSPENRSAWTPDSTAVLRRLPTGGVGLLDLASGTVVEVGGEFGSINLFAVRVDSAATVTELSPLATGVQLIGLAESGDVVTVDVDSGAVVTVEAPGFDSSTPSTVFPDAGGAWVVSQGGEPSIRFDSTTLTTAIVEVASPGKIVAAGPVANSVWREPSIARGSGQAIFELVDPLGRSLGATIDLGPGDQVDVIGGDGRGGLLVASDLGGVYIATADGVRQQLTTGEVLAIGATVAYVRECDASLVCGAVRVDRLGGERRLLDDLALGDVESIRRQDVPAGFSVSPDGEALFARSPGDGGLAFIVDLATDRRVAFSGIAPGSPIIWTADSAYAIWLAGGAVNVFDRGTATVRTVNTVELRAIAAVPADVATIVAPDPAVQLAVASPAEPAG